MTATSTFSSFHDAKAAIVEHLRAAGLRPTTARIGVWQILEARAPERLDAETVFRDMLSSGLVASQGTVYRALKDFVEHGFALQEWRASLCGGKAVYTRSQPQASVCDTRIVCEHCGCATQVHDPALQERLQQLAQAQGLDVAAQPMTILVVCTQCAKHQHIRRRAWPGYRGH
ncbi:Fur family transcriptional regulator, ferric uptake regulator [Lampropedia hyalina DSM 16112]|jgi:Fe2+ or Zn2+ uptake regulation protein|uniref:Fur family transcriptional regulator, ferric uptake regulator n=1 Tax=Lampropedia hyalina DSM 16112 TaxID=1122156 RepID=A0A1M5C0X5_9BURK|nr:transcriptional repressor [Lampropedia hyalina]SHF48325.1 Fur family transcriptional regulator, ferric uptake regulator [Lampropedia hyalina DSM 16112]